MHDVYLALIGGGAFVVASAMFANAWERASAAKTAARHELLDRALDRDTR